MCEFVKVRLSLCWQFVACSLGSGGKECGGERGVNSKTGMTGKHSPVATGCVEVLTRADMPS
jgi:hypothetical protein